MSRMTLFDIKQALMNKCAFRLCVCGSVTRLAEDDSHLYVWPVISLYTITQSIRHLASRPEFSCPSCNVLRRPRFLHWQNKWTGQSLWNEITHLNTRQQELRFSKSVITVRANLEKDLLRVLGKLSESWIAHFSRHTHPRVHGGHRNTELLHGNYNDAVWNTCRDMSANVHIK